MRRPLSRIVPGRLLDRSARDRDRPARPTAEPVRRGIGIAHHHSHLVDREAQGIGGESRDHRPQPLPHGAQADRDGHSSVAVKPDVGRVLRRPVAVRAKVGRRDSLHVGRVPNADPVGGIVSENGAPLATSVLSPGDRALVCLMMAARVDHRARRRLERQLVGTDHVQPAQIVHVDLELPGDLVDQALHCKHRLGDAEPPVGAGRNLVGGHRDHRDLLLGDPVGADKRPGGDECRIEAVGKDLAGTEVLPDGAADGLDRAVIVHRSFEVDSHVAGVAGRDQVLIPILDPPHRLSQLDRQPGHHVVLRIHLRLLAKGAADIGCDHADVSLGQAEHVGIHRPGDVRELGGRPYGKPAVAVLRRHAPALHRCRGVPADLE